MGKGSQNKARLHEGGGWGGGGEGGGQMSTKRDTDLASMKN